MQGVTNPQAVRFLAFKYVKRELVTVFIENGFPKCTYVNGSLCCLEDDHIASIFYCCVEAETI